MADRATVKVEGLREVLYAIEHLWPKDKAASRAILNQGMGASARKHVLPVAKQMAASTRRSGALAESLGVRVIRKNDLPRLEGNPDAGVRIVPARMNMKAMTMYVNYYYIQKGKMPPKGIFNSGIRHGHFVEFGINQSPHPFLWPSAVSRVALYEKDLAKFFWKKIQARVKRTSKKAERLSKK